MDIKQIKLFEIEGYLVATTLSLKQITDDYREYIKKHEELNGSSVSVYVQEHYNEHIAFEKWMKERYGRELVFSFISLQRI